MKRPAAGWDKHYSTKMFKTEPSRRNEHCAVCVDNCVILLGGLGTGWPKPSNHEIWVYNLYTEEWKRCVIRKAPKPFYGAIGVAIEGNIFTFGGEDSENFSARNALWKLSRSKEGIFTWSFINC